MIDTTQLAVGPLIPPRTHDTRRPNRALRRSAMQAARRQKKARVTHKHCPRCGLAHIAATTLRCQCQTDQRLYRCSSCGYDVVRTRSQWHTTSFCDACADQLQEQWDNEEASRGEAIARFYERCDLDEEQHRAAMERDDQR